MSFLEVFILGVVQGIGEFLPISSSAHLILIPYLFNFDLNMSNSMSLAFDVSLHFGTLVAVIAVFYKDWLALFNGAFKKVFKKQSSFENKMFWYLVLATIPGSLIGKLLENYIEDYFRKMILAIAILMAVMGIIIYLGDKWADKRYKKQTDYKDLTLKQTFLIGISQAAAIFPGFSRSGTTMLTARLLGVKREAAAKFSFLLSVPIIFGATLLKFDELITNFNNTILLGIITSAVVGYLSIKFLLGYIKNHDFSIFAYYRLIFALVIIIKLILN